MKRLVGWAVSAAYRTHHSYLSTMGRRLTLVVCAAVLFAGAVGTQFYRVEMKAQGFQAGALGKQEVFYVPPKEVLRFAALGREEFLADIMFVRCYAYFLEHLFSDRIFEWVDTYVEAILHLDPNNPRVYQWATQMAKYGQLITNEAIERSNAYAMKGMAQFPNDWRFYMDVGFNLYFEYKYANDEEKRKGQDRALEYFTIAANLPNSELDPNFITELYMRKNETQMALLQAYRAYHEASERERRYLRRRIAQLEMERMESERERVKTGDVSGRIRELRGEETRWQERYPFMPFEGFQVLVSSEAARLPKVWGTTEATDVYETYRKAGER